LSKLKSQYEYLKGERNNLSALQISSKSKMGFIFQSHPSLDDRIMALQRNR
jgi:Zn-dependent protease with chaperone function